MPHFRSRWSAEIREGVSSAKTLENGAPPSPQDESEFGARRDVTRYLPGLRPLGDTA